MLEIGSTHIRCDTSNLTWHASSEVQVLEVFSRGFWCGALPHCALLPQQLPLLLVVVAPTTPAVVQGSLRVHCVPQLPLAPLGR